MHAYLALNYTKMELLDTEHAIVTPLLLWKRGFYKKKWKLKFINAT